MDGWREGDKQIDRDTLSLLSSPLSSSSFTFHIHREYSFLSPNPCLEAEEEEEDQKLPQGIHLIHPSIHDAATHCSRCCLLRSRRYGSVVLYRLFAASGWLWLCKFIYPSHSSLTRASSLTHSPLSSSSSLTHFPIIISSRSSQKQQHRSAVPTTPQSPTANPAQTPRSSTPNTATTATAGQINSMASAHMKSRRRIRLVVRRIVRR